MSNYKNVMNETIESFNNNYCYLMNLKYSYESLFTDEEFADKAFSKAGLFFQELNTLYIHQILLVMAKLIDPSALGKNSNLSVFYIIEKFFDQKDQLELMTIIQDMIEIREPIRLARHKLIAHSDLTTILRFETVGGFDKDQGVKYFIALKLFVEKINFQLLNQTFDYTPNCSGDVSDFLKIFLKGLQS